MPPDSRLSLSRRFRVSLYGSRSEPTCVIQVFGELAFSVRGECEGRGGSCSRTKALLVDIERHLPTTSHVHKRKGQECHSGEDAERGNCYRLLENDLGLEKGVARGEEVNQVEELRSRQ